MVFSLSSKTVEFRATPSKIDIPNEKIVKASAGFHHSLFLTQTNKVFACGLNNYGQCAKSSLGHIYLPHYHEVYLALNENEKITEMASGKSHNLFLTSEGRVLFCGASQNGQFITQSKMEEICSPQEITFFRHFLDNDERVTRIRCGNDCCAVITNKGKCFAWGPDEMRQKRKEVEFLNESKGIREGSQIKDVGFGFRHTIVLTE